MLKRLFDIIFSFLGLLILWPLFLVVAFLIKRDCVGPVFYRGQRIGRFGKKFKIYKFRTMVKNAEKIGGSTASEDDLRITKIGKFLRKYKIDELPQLINVLKGEMSFVGPRPEVEEVVKMYNQEEKKLLEIRPGITDYASLKFSNEGEIVKGNKDPHQIYLEKIWPEKKRLGLEYVKNNSLWIDLKIIFKTIKSLIR